MVAWCMTQPERFPPDDPREWMGRARGNLARAKRRAPGDYLEDLCFDAQQAAEKALKAVLISRGVEFPYTHDVGRLLSLLEVAGNVIPEEVRRAEILSDYAWASRYPSAAPPISEQAYADAIRMAEAVVRWVDKRL